MRGSGKLVASAVVAFSLIASSTAAVASTAPAPAPTSDGWVTLTALSPSGTALIDSAAVAAVQPDSTIPPGTQTCPDGSVIPATATCGGPGAYTGPSTPPIPVLLVWAAVLGAMIYILTKNNHHHPQPNSPA